MKKRSFAILCSLFAALVCIVLVGCGGGGGNADVSESKYIGTWTATNVSAFDETEDADEVFGGEFIVVLNGDGTATITAEGETATGTWSETSTGFTVKGDDFNTTFKEVEGGVETSIIGVKIFFVQS